MSEEFVIVGRPLPRLRAVQLLDGHWLRVTWDSGATNDVDVSPAIMSRKAFVRLRTDRELFETARTDELCDAAHWLDGSALSAVRLERLIATAAMEKGR